jgi:hypothetical protein
MKHQETQETSAHEQKHAVERGGSCGRDAQRAGEPPSRAEGVGKAKHPGAHDGDDDVPQRLRGRRPAPTLQQRRLSIRRHRSPANLGLNLPWPSTSSLWIDSFFARFSLSHLWIYPAPRDARG